MERFQMEREKALRNIRIADHMLHVTYPLLQDPKLLLSVMDNIFLGVTYTMTAILHYERFFKRIPPFHDNFESKFNLFKLTCMPARRIDKGIAEFILEVKELAALHRKSPVEFRKNGQLVICHEDFSVTTISMGMLKGHLLRAKQFTGMMDTVLSNHERIPGRSEGRIEAR